MTLAIFDFDGTITTRDSFLDFLFYAHGIPKTLLAIGVNLPAILLMFILKSYRKIAKERIYRFLFKGWTVEQYERIALRYVTEALPKIIRPKALDKLKWHQSQGHKIVIVSASMANYLKFWTQSKNFDLLATEGEIIDGHLTGRFSTANCYGEEKVRRLNKSYHLTEYQHITAYGDSRGDLALKSIAQEFHYKPFRN